ncbi:MAG: hypothetical protein ACKVOU_03350 [Cytophagales bacterium]
MVAEKEKIIKESLGINGFETYEALALHHSILILLSKIEESRNLSIFFAHKYQKTYLEFSKEVLSKIEVEDFEQSDDRNEWQFAEESLRSYIEKVNVLRNG